MTDLTTDAPTCFVGCDVGKKTITVFDSATGRTVDIANTKAALDAFAADLVPGCLVICEATGGYEALLLDAVIRAGHTVHRADARKVKAFIRSLGTLAKTDAIDARALARYGQERHDRLTRWQPREQDREILHTLVATRGDLVRDRTAITNRLAAPGASPVAKELRGLAKSYDKAIAQLEDRIAKLIDTSEPLAHAARILRAIPGIGATTAAGLIAYMPELGTLDRKQAASLAGLAPHPRQSGSLNAYRRTRGGRPEVKRLLFMAALSAVRYDTNLKAFYLRLKANGKKPIVALVAAMRKLITIANAKLRDQLIIN
jgi:transposase